MIPAPIFMSVAFRAVIITWYGLYSASSPHVMRLCLGEAILDKNLVCSEVSSAALQMAVRPITIIQKTVAVFIFIFCIVLYIHFMCVLIEFVLESTFSIDRNC